MRSAVTIETRAYTIDYVKDHFKYLDDNWRLVFFGSKQNKDQVLKLYPDCIFYIWDVKEFTLQKYNELLITETFWNLIPDEEILIFHHDSGLLKKGIEKFFEYDYVGSPWIRPEWGGNGGLSIRKKSIMLECINKQPEFKDWTNEDGYFCDIMLRHKIGKLASRTICLDFACETIYKLGTYGYHNIRGYLSEDEVYKIMNQYV